ncbi:hypothetical protein QJQ45_024222 [Haematococcus lacustris]|nr:hypothetical protein QJQ45_024222 [Haematococcus lacustris]
MTPAPLPARDGEATPAASDSISYVRVLYPQSMYVRVKRKKQTIFLHVEPTDTVLEVKQKLQELVDQPPENQQLLKGTMLLEDAKKIAEMKVENDDILALTLMQPADVLTATFAIIGTWALLCADGTFEAVNIAQQE